MEDDNDDKEARDRRDDEPSSSGGAFSALAMGDGAAAGSSGKSRTGAPRKVSQRSPEDEAPVDRRDKPAGRASAPAGRGKPAGGASAPAGRGKPAGGASAPAARANAPAARRDAGPTTQPQAPRPSQGASLGGLLDRLRAEQGEPFLQRRFTALLIGVASLLLLVVMLIVRALDSPTEVAAGDPLPVETADTVAVQAEPEPVATEVEVAPTPEPTLEPTPEPTSTPEAPAGLTVSAEGAEATRTRGTAFILRNGNVRAVLPDRAPGDQGKIVLNAANRGPAIAIATSARHVVMLLENGNVRLWDSTLPESGRNRVAWDHASGNETVPADQIAASDTAVGLVATGSLVVHDIERARNRLVHDSASEGVISHLTANEVGFVYALEDGSIRAIGSAPGSVPIPIGNEAPGTIDGIVAALSTLYVRLDDGSVRAYPLDVPGSPTDVWDPAAQGPAVQIAALSDGFAVSLAEGGVSLVDANGETALVWDPEAGRAPAWALTSGGTELALVVGRGTALLVSPTDEVSTVWDAADETVPPAVAVIAFRPTT